MRISMIWLILFSTGLVNCNQQPAGRVLKIEMDLSSFGVESDSYPSIHAFINLATDSSNCKKTYDDPKYRDSVYSLSRDDLKQIHKLTNIENVEKLKNKYSVNRVDQPKSTITFYTNTKKIVVEDYGLKGDYPLRELYRIVYQSNLLF